MSLVKVQGNVSGTGVFTVAAPNSNTDRTLTLPDATGTVVSTGDTGTVTPTMLSQKLTSGTAVTSTSGTAIDFTGVPSWVKRITVMFDGVSTNGTSIYQVQLGTSSGVQTSSYNGNYSYNGPTNTGASISTGFGIYNDGASNTKTGFLVINLLNNNIWTCNGIIAQLVGVSGYNILTAGSKSLGGTLDRIRITTVNGTDTFDAGSINIMYE